MCSEYRPEVVRAGRRVLLLTWDQLELTSVQEGDLEQIER